MHVLFVAGARPNFMKVAPVLAAAVERGAATTLVHTGQHYDAAMSGVFFDELGLRAPDHFLDVGSGSHAGQTAGVMTAFEPLLAAVRPDVVVVVGDVNSTLACALVTAKSGIPLAHVEAGLRSRDWAMPEEVNRVVVDRVSDLLFVTSPDAAGNLRREGYRPDQTHLVGNVMVDTLLANIERARARPTLPRLGLHTGGYGLVTLHRPANVDDPDVLAGLLGALGKVAEQCPLVFPLHPRTRARVEGRLPAGVTTLPPAGYLDFLALQAGARVVLTDSGGVQEETTVLGVPCLTLRDTTERAITVTEGTNQVIGTDPERVVAVATEVLARPPRPRRPALWDGRAGERIVEILLAGDYGGHGRRPTDITARTAPPNAAPASVPPRSVAARGR
ncbi:MULTISPECIES: non-hydrolyzing UDP-N-acetylglucosamine 2-epimerase [Protofrankia]|uniref:UDP-N-acetylglucosamine 2-epimerase n=1 Tax=Protofrankia coriariae TaxID=1562887 RepID=A0ABR5F5G5_9ACTN|nr:MULTISPECIES: UDP-N-acetylglucosamine 2-epimerase (non-hydrolyzing) [Protofrankia]KLL11937.1 UDP-N-acetylglucosamine 2-epimerase [Protofrankia coriariae]ONH36813.1 UDP-N-acetylglucosamine 2-epimerase [Protofrankia sp. BMG5.30]